MQKSIQFQVYDIIEGSKGSIAIEYSKRASVSHFESSEVYVQRKEQIEVYILAFRRITQ